MKIGSNTIITKKNPLIHLKWEGSCFVLYIQFSNTIHMDSIKGMVGNNGLREQMNPAPNHKKQ
jgi:hypothetical protein